MSMFGHNFIRGLVLVVVAFLVAPHTDASGQGTAAPRSLQSLVNDTAAQFQLAYRHDPAERQRRFEQLAAAVKSWRAAARSEANNRALAEWLRAAMRSSMPGSRTALLELPAFAAGVAANKATAPATMGDKSVGDPFADDPLPAQD
jgi:hypothetical protein